MGNPIPTRIKFPEFFKTIERIAVKKFNRCNIVNKGGSARRIELFSKKDDNVPCDFLVVHLDKTVWSGDLKKACEKLGVSKKEFMDTVDSL